MIWEQNSRTIVMVMNVQEKATVSFVSHDCLCDSTCGLGEVCVVLALRSKCANKLWRS